MNAYCSHIQTYIRIQSSVLTIKKTFSFQYRAELYLFELVYPNNKCMSHHFHCHEQGNARASFGDSLRAFDWLTENTDFPLAIMHVFCILIGSSENLFANRNSLCVPLQLISIVGLHCVDNIYYRISYILT